MKEPIYIQLSSCDVAYTKKIEDVTEPHEIFEALSFCTELEDKNPADFIVYVDFDSQNRVVGIEVI